jgi:Putative prokaryotic signal transducing protein
MPGQAVKSLPRAGCGPRCPVSPSRADEMKELLRTNDLVRLSWAQAMLADEGIETLVLDQHTSIVEGSIGAIQRRLMVGERDYQRARALIRAAREGAG